jgi:4-hydroxybenzoate polyprenyltransferase
MGFCRGLNLSLGMAILYAVVPVALGPAAMAVVVGHVLYITGITIAARREADLAQSRTRLIGGWTICVLGAAVIAFSSILEPARTLRLEPYWVFPLMIAILMLPLGRRIVDAVRSLQPQRLGLAIRQAILSILFLDAAMALQYSGDWPGIVICLMVLPTLLLARWFRST